MRILLSCLTCASLLAFTGCGTSDADPAGGGPAVPASATTQGGGSTATPATGAGEASAAPAAPATATKEVALNISGMG